jgi:hypothetical protein
MRALYVLFASIRIAGGLVQVFGLAGSLLI